MDFQLIPRNLENVANGFQAVVTKNGSDQVLGTTSHQVSQNEHHTDGFNIQNFHHLKREGYLLPMTPFSQHRELGSTSGQLAVYNNGQLSYYCTPSWQAKTHWLIGLSDYENYLPSNPDVYVGEAAGKIYQNGFDALTFLAELASVKRLFLDTGYRLYKLLVKRKLGTLADLRNDWLSSRYGWRTLYYDIESLRELLSKFGESRQRYSDHAGTKYSTGNCEVIPISDDPVATINGLVNDVVNISMRGSVVADVQIPKLQFNPLQTGWELIPLSFVVDWFLSVGRTIAAWSFLSLRPSYVASYGVKVEIDRSFSLQVNFKSPYSGVIQQTGHCVGSYEVRVPCRVPLTPHFTVKLDWAKVIDLIALLSQRIH